MCAIMVMWFRLSRKRACQLDNSSGVISTSGFSGASRLAPDGRLSNGASAFNRSRRLSEGFAGAVAQDDSGVEHGGVITCSVGGKEVEFGKFIKEFVG